MLEIHARLSSANSSSLEIAADAAAPEQPSPKHAQGDQLMDSIDDAKSGAHTPSNEAASEMQSDSADVCASEAKEGVSPCEADLSKEASICASDVSRQVSGTEADVDIMHSFPSYFDRTSDMVNENALDDAQGFVQTPEHSIEKAHSAGISQPSGSACPSNVDIHGVSRQNGSELLDSMGMRRRSLKTTQSASTKAASQQSMAYLPHTRLSQALHTHVAQHSRSPGAILSGASHAATSGALDDIIDLTED